MNIWIYIFLVAISMLLGIIAGCCIRLNQENVSIKWSIEVFKVLYYFTFGFVGFASKNKDILIDIIANNGVEKGSDNRKEKIIERKRELEEAWSKKKYLKSIRNIMIKALFTQFDFLTNEIIGVIKSLSKYKNNYKKNKREKVIRSFNFTEVSNCFNMYIKAGQL